MHAVHVFGELNIRRSINSRNFYPKIFISFDKRDDFLKSIQLILPQFNPFFIWRKPESLYSVLLSRGVKNYGNLLNDRITRPHQ